MDRGRHLTFSETTASKSNVDISTTEGVVYVDVMANLANMANMNIYLIQIYKA